jgi:uncharacterized protein YcbK (DUF882 family)
VRHLLSVWRFLLFCVAVLASATLSTSAGRAAEPGLADPDPFALDGRAKDGVGLPERRPDFKVLRLRHHWTGEDLSVLYRIGDRHLPGAMQEINRFMRDWRCDQATVMDPKLIDRLYELQVALGSRRTMRLISAYRSEGYNASLLRAGRTVDPDSEHMFGRAADIFVPGLPLDELRAAAEKTGGGTGYYPFSGPRFIHIDAGPTRHWSEMDPAVRRRLNLTVPARKPLTIDCSLTMAEVLREVPVTQVMAALPAGASTGNGRNLHPAAYTEPPAEADRGKLDVNVRAGSMSGAIRAEELCQESKGMAALNPAALLSQ